MMRLLLSRSRRVSPRLERAPDHGPRALGMAAMAGLRAMTRWPLPGMTVLVGKVKSMPPLMRQPERSTLTPLRLWSSIHSPSSVRPLGW